MRVALVALLLLAVTAFSSDVLAQGTGSPPPLPAQPPPPAAYPPAYPAYPYPPYSYPYPPYAYPVPVPQPAAPPKTLPYEGGAVPEGYRLEESVRRGPVIAGAVTFGAAYVLGITAASGYSFRNQSGWLAIPLAGPFITMATRESRCMSSSTDNSSVYVDTPCEQDGPTVRMLLVLDGLAQVTGVALFAWGMSTTSRRLVRNDVARLVVAPSRVGSGYGLGAVGSF